MKPKRKEKYTPPPRTGTLYPNIVNFSRRLGVHRTTLYRAITGRSGNLQLVQQYQQLIGKDT